MPAACVRSASHAAVFAIAAILSRCPEHRRRRVYSGRVAGPATTPARLSRCLAIGQRDGIVLCRPEQEILLPLPPWSRGGDVDRLARYGVRIGRRSSSQPACHSSRSAVGAYARCGVQAPADAHDFFGVCPSARTLPPAPRSARRSSPPPGSASPTPGCDPAGMS